MSNTTFIIFKHSNVKYIRLMVNVCLLTLVVIYLSRYVETNDN